MPARLIICGELVSVLSPPATRSNVAHMAAWRGTCLMPDPVLGGATLLMFGTVAAAGIRIIAAQDINRKATLVLAVSLSLGLGVELMPDILGAAPQVIRGIFSSGITTGGLTAILANLFIRVKEDQTE